MHVVYHSSMDVIRCIPGGGGGGGGGWEVLEHSLNPLTAGAVHICFFTFFISTLHISF